MPIRLENTHTGRVTEMALPEEIAPPDRTYPTKDAKAAAERDAGRQRRLLDTLRKSKRYRVTDKPVTLSTERQRTQARLEGERRRMEAELRAEYERELELEKAKLRREAGVQGDDSEQEDTPEPSAAQVRVWAKDNGHEVPARGTIPADVVAAYKAAHSGGGE